MKASTSKQPRLRLGPRIAQARPHAWVAAATMLVLASCSSGPNATQASTPSPTRPLLAGRIVFVDRPVTPGPQSVYSIAADGNQRELVDTPSQGLGEDDHPRFSPDGTKILFDRGELGRIVVVQADGTGLRTVTLGCTGSCLGDEEPAWSPDGNQMAFERALGPLQNGTPRDIGIWIADANGANPHQVTQLAPDSGWEDHYPSFSPAGTELLFMRDGNHHDNLDQASIWRIGVDGTNPRLVHRLPADRPGGGGKPRWSPDGSRILFSDACYFDSCPYPPPFVPQVFTIRPSTAHPGDHWKLRTIVVPGRTVDRVLTQGCRRVGGMRWLRNRALRHAGERDWDPAHHDIYGRRLRSLQPRLGGVAVSSKVLTCVQRRAKVASWLAIMTIIVLAACGSGSLVTQAPTPTATSVGKNDPWILYERVNPQGENIPTLYLVRPDGSAQHVLLPGFTDATRANEHPDWSPDGQRIAFAAQRGDRLDLWIVNADGTGARRLVSCDDPCNTVNDPDWSSDGRKILFGQDDLPLGPGGVPTGFEFKGLDLASNTVTTILSRRDGMTADSARWSPDGRQIVFTRARLSASGEAIGQALFVTDVAGGHELQLTPWDSFAAYPDWGPDGRIVFSTYSDLDGLPPPTKASNLFLIMADGTGLKQLTTFAAGNMRGTQPRWTPGQSAIVFTQDDLARELRWMATIKPDGTGLALATYTAVMGTRPEFRPIP
jgi:Tol biopolymer transport system component